MKLVHWPFMGGLLHLVPQEGHWAGPQPIQAPPRCTKLTAHPLTTPSEPVAIFLYNGSLLCSCNLPIKGLKSCNVLRCVVTGQSRQHERSYRGLRGCAEGVRWSQGEGGWARLETWTKSQRCFENPLTAFVMFLIISAEMTCKTGQISVCASMQCKHFQNPKAPKLLPCMFYGFKDKTCNKWNSEFRRSHHAGDMTHPEWVIIVFFYCCILLGWVNNVCVISLVPGPAVAGEVVFCCQMSIKMSQCLLLLPAAQESGYSYCSLFSTF